MIQQSQHIVHLGKKDVAAKMKNLELGEDRGAEQRFDYDSEEEGEQGNEEQDEPEDTGGKNQKENQRS